MSIYYILKDKKPVQVERMQWVDSFDEDRFNECSSGIHFFITKQEAIDY